MRKITLGVFLLLQIICFGQNALVPNFDQSADATVLGKQGYIPVSHYSGQPDISVPIYSLSANGVNLDLGLQYDASGVAVDRHPGWVGQNWSLMAGGAVTRTVNGNEDERGIILSPRFYNINIAYFDLATTTPDMLEFESTNSTAELKTFANNRRGVIAGYSLVIDSEPDMFHFKMGNISGRFYFGDDGDFKIISDYNLKIEFDVMDTLNYHYPFIENVIGTPNKKFHKVIKGFKIIDDQGNKYTFGHDQNAIEYTHPFFRQYSFTNNAFFYFNNWVANVWHLTKVEDHRSNVLYTLEYEPSFFTAQLYENINSQKVECKDNLNDDWEFLSQSVSPSGSGSLLRPVYLKKIITNKNEEVLFKKSVATQLEFPYTALFQQEALDIESELGQYYPDPILFPFPYLQQEQYPTYDPEGAYENPMKGLKWNKLDSIIVYQNGIRIKNFSFEYNNVSTQRLNLLKFKNLPISGSQAPQIHEFVYNQFEALPPYFFHQVDHFGYHNGTDEYTPADPTTGYFNFADLNTNYYPSRNSDPNFVKLGHLKQIKYPTGGRSEFEFEWHDYGKILSTNRQSLISESGNMGGLRIKSIAQFDGIQSSPVTKKQYFYVKNYQTNGTESSGILAFKPSYVFTNWLSATDSHEDGGIRQSSFSRNLLTPLYNHIENPVSYSEVVEVNLDNSYNIYKFSSYADVKDELPYATLDLNYSPYMRFQEKNMYRGRLLAQNSYNHINEAVASTENYYNSAMYNSTGSTEFDASINSFFGFGCIPNNGDKYFYGNAIKIYHFKPYIDSTVVKQYFGSDVVSTKIQYQNAFPVVNNNKYIFLTQKSTTNSDGKIFSDHNSYPFNHLSTYAGQNAHMTTLINAHRFPLVYTEKKVNSIVIDGTQDLYANFSGTILPKYRLRNEATWVGGVLTNAWDTIQQIDTYSLPFLKPTSITDRGWQAESITINGRGYPTTWLYGGHNRSYVYYSNDRLQTLTEIDGQQKTFEYDLFNRMKKATDIPKNVFTDYSYHYSTTVSDRSYLKSKTKYPLTTSSAIDSIVNYNYVDGLGRLVQTINRNGAPDGTSDVITKNEYDNQGRQYRRYEPISVNGNNGNFYSGTFSGGFLQQLYQSNPLDRPSQTTPPAWQSTNHSYSTNITSLTNPEGLVYPTRSLMITSSTDPDGKTIDIYTDKMGRKVLQRRRQSTNINDTWTVYDDKDRPIRQYPSGSNTATSGLIFEFRYDGADNMTYKKVPDAGAEEYRYDSRNLMVAHRNPVLLAQNKWLVTHYDQYGRQSKRGYFNGSTPTPADQPTIHTLLEEYFYDGFNGSSTNTAPIYKGKLRKKQIKALDDLAINTTWVETQYSYDIYGRVSQENITNHLGETEIISYTYDFADNVMTNSHLIIGEVTHQTAFTYDHQGRKGFERHTLNNGAEVTTSQCKYDHKNQIIERNLGRHATTGTHQYLQSLDYTYNPQGWLTTINTLYTDLLPFTSDPCTGDIQSYEEHPLPITTDEQDLFALSLDFNSTLSGSGIPASQNGNITALKWWHRNSGQYNQSYTYRYDFLNRVTEAKHGEIKQGVHTLKNHYNEKLEYDPRGNITKLDRRGMVQRPDIDGNCYKPMTIDSLTYVYENGTNKLVQVIDNAPCMDTITLPAVIDRDVNYAAGQLIRIKSTDVLCNNQVNLIAGNEIRIIDTLHIPNNCGTPALVVAYQGPCPQDKYTEGFNQQSTIGQYGYSSAGNMIYDPNKQLLFYYNHLNLPYLIIGAENDEIELLYGSDGTLLQRKYLKNNIEISKIDYLRGKERLNGVLKNIYFSDGRIVKTDAAFSFEYAIKDHLGNVRVTFSDDNNNGLITGTEIRSRNDYYAFGMEWDNYLQQSEFKSPINRFQYNGKEYFQEMELDQYAYGARFYDAVLGRFTGVDALSSDFTYVNPYNYAENNPIVNIDLHGLQALRAFQAGLTGNDDQGFFRPSSPSYRENNPFMAGVGDATFLVIDFLGINALDNAFFGNNESTSGQKLAAVGTVLLNTRGGVDDGLKSTVKSTVKLRESAKTGQEAHRQIQSELKTQGAEIEQNVQLKDRVVRKDAIMPDGTKIIIKPNTPTGQRSASRRERLMQVNGHKTEKIFYDPKNPAYQPNSPTYIGPKKKK